MKSVVLTLPDDVHTAVERAAQLERKAAPELIVDVVANWLATRATPDTERQLTEYVQVVAGTRDDLDPDLETAGIESLLENTQPQP